MFGPNVGRLQAESGQTRPMSQHRSESARPRCSPLSLWGPEIGRSSLPRNWAKLAQLRSTSTDAGPILARGRPRSERRRARTSEADRADGGMGGTSARPLPTASDGTGTAPASHAVKAFTRTSGPGPRRWRLQGDGGGEAPRAGRTRRRQGAGTAKRRRRWPRHPKRRGRRRRVDGSA